MKVLVIAVSRCTCAQLPVTETFREYFEIRAIVFLLRRLVTRLRMTRKVETQLKPVLSMLGSRPGAEAVEVAMQTLFRIETKLSVDVAEELLDSKKNVHQEAAEKEKLPYLAVIQLEMLHQFHEDMLQQSTKAPTSPTDSETCGEAVELEKLFAETPGKTLEHFDFSGKALKSFPRSWTAMSSLISLNLSNNQLEALPSDVGGLVNLVELNVHSNQLKSLPDSIGNLSKLTILNVSGNQLKTLPMSLSKCSKMLELNAHFNQLEIWLPVFGWKLAMLRKLELQFNNLVTLPESFGYLSGLEHLDLSNNRLCCLPTSVGLLSHLKTLDLSRNFNNLCNLPHSLGNLTCLSTLDLCFNQIRVLPSSLGKLQNLKNLVLDQNPLTVPPKQVIEHSQEAVMAYLLDLYENGAKIKQSNTRQKGNKLSTRSPVRSSPACLMIPASPRYDHAGGWVPVRAGNTRMRTFLGQWMCWRGMGGSSMRWQEYNSDDEE